MQVRHDKIQVYVLRAAAGGYEALLLRRVLGDYMGGTWQTVYGGIEPGETAWRAAIRELHEETGLKPGELYQLNFVNTFYLAKEDAIWNSACFCAIVKAESAVVLNEEHDAHEWLDPAEFSARLIWPGDRNAFAEVVSQIIGSSSAKPYLRIHLD